MELCSHHYNLVLEHFCHFKKFLCAHRQSFTTPTCPAPSKHWSAFKLRFTFPEIPYTWNIQCNIFCLPLSIMYLRFFCVVPCISSFLLLCSAPSDGYMTFYLCTHHVMGMWTVSNWQLLTVFWTFVYMSLWPYVFISLGYIPRNCWVMW